MPRLFTRKLRKKTRGKIDKLSFEHSIEKEVRFTFPKQKRGAPHNPKKFSVTVHRSKRLREASGVADSKYARFGDLSIGINTKKRSFGIRVEKDIFYDENGVPTSKKRDLVVTEEPHGVAARSRDIISVSSRKEFPRPKTKKRKKK